jgi:YVTN family beta-propeller protein
MMRRFLTDGFRQSFYCRRVRIHVRIGTFQKELNPMARIVAIVISALLFSTSAARANHTKVYVANQGANTVTVIDDQRVNAMVAANAMGRTPAENHAAVARQDFAVIATIPVGSNPIAIGMSADGTLAYVANLNSNSVSIIDTELDAVVATIAVGTPRDVEATPDGKYVLVVNQSANTVTVLDASNYTVVMTVAVGNFPCAIAIAPDGSAAYVTNRLSNNVSIIDLTTFEVTNVAVGTFACDVMLSPDGRWAVVPNRLSGNITIIDTGSKIAVATVATGTNPQGVAFSPDGTKAYVTNAATTSVVDMTSFTVIDTITDLTSGICAVAATMDMNRGHEGHVYVASGTQSGRVNVIDVGSNSVVATFTVGARPGGIGIRMWPRMM